MQLAHEVPMEFEPNYHRDLEALLDKVKLPLYMGWYKSFDRIRLHPWRNKDGTQSNTFICYLMARSPFPVRNYKTYITEDAFYGFAIALPRDIGEPFFSNLMEQWLAKFRLQLEMGTARKIDMDGGDLGGPDNV